MGVIAWNRLTGYAKTWVYVWVICAAVAVLLIAFSPVGGWRYWKWESRDAGAFGLLFALLALAFLMHKLDSKLHGFGFVDVYKSSDAQVALDETAAASVLTVDSIRAALAGGVLAVMPSSFSSVATSISSGGSVRWGEVITDPRQTLFVIVMACLGSSVMMTLASVLCSDYSIRFTWHHAVPRKLALRRKAQLFDKAGFYLLTWSLPAIATLVDHYAGVIASTVAFLVMWAYYFFDKGDDVKGLDAGSDLNSFIDRIADDHRVTLNALVTLEEDLPGAPLFRKGDIVTLGMLWPRIDPTLRLLSTRLPDPARWMVIALVRLGDRCFR